MTHPGLPASFLLLAATATLEGQAPAPGLDAHVTQAWTQAFGLTRLDGALHAAGPTYAARISATGIVLMPLSGPRVDRPCALSLSLDSIRRGGALVHQAQSVEPREEGLVVRVPRAAGIEERFDVRRDGIEHSFVFAQPLPGTGDLVVTLRVESDLESAASGDGLCFAKPDAGGVTIGGVTGIDADGRRARGTLHHEAGRLEYRLPAAFVDAARYPLVLDPVLGSAITVLPQQSSTTIADVDLAFDAGNAVYLVVWARGTAAGATQIQAQRVSAAGALVGGLITIHPAATGEIVANPTVANVNAADRFLVAYERTPPAADIEVRARAVDAASGAVSSSSTLIATAARSPDVGGRSASSGITALVAFETVTTSQIHAQVVTLPIGAIVSPPALLGSAVTVASQAGFDEHRPAVARHEGAAGNYLVVWEREVAGRTFIGGRVVGNSSGAVLLTPMTTITPGTDPNESAPDCATADGTSFLVVYEGNGRGEIAGKPASYAAASGTLTVGPEAVLAVAAATPLPCGSSAIGEPAVDFADTRYLVVHRTSCTVTDALGRRVTTSVRLQEVGPACCLLPATQADVESGMVSTSGFIINGASVDRPVVCAAFSGNRASQNDEGMIAFVRGGVSTSGIPPATTTTLGVGARRAEAIGAGGPVTTLAPGCGGAGTAGVNGPAAVGNPHFAFTLSGMPAGTSATLFNLSAPAQRFGCASCQILPYAIVLFVAGAGGSATLPVSIPCDPSLVNATVAAQWTVLGNPTSPCAALPQFGFSNTLSVTLSR
jgi:hypothetical protein